MKTIYYAHALCVYGTPCEQKELKAIRSRFRKCRVVNPARYSSHPEKLRDNVEFCLRLVAKCDIVVFSCILGKVTAGVGKEVNHALKLGKIVYEIKPAGLVQRQRAVKYISRLKSIQLYRKWWRVRGGN